MIQGYALPPELSRAGAAGWADGWGCGCGALYATGGCAAGVGASVDAGVGAGISKICESSSRNARYPRTTEQLALRRAKVLQIGPN